ncbi:ATP-grasp domain-containing protein [Ancylobacter terrae]|uniref:ATP-grasp domain-containing protein n=1 Tax=Ancylobacter sp. sgz301288 TaxID=3342077 RepID=UPI003858C8D0
MLVFVCETVTGGGLAGNPLPPSLLAEATLMRDALIGDLEDLPGVRVITTHDSRLPPPPRGESVPVDGSDGAKPLWAELAAKAHCCWPIAPETGGELADLAALMAANGSRVIASDLATLNLCASKRATAQALGEAGIATVPTWAADAVPAGASGPFVVKPDDGAGSLDTRLVEPLPAELPHGVVVQPFRHGRPASLVMLCQSGRAHVLAASLQHMEVIDDRFVFRGVTVGGLPIEPDWRVLAERLLEALPGLHGLIGVDFLATADGAVVLEINPRLTTSYAGLRASLGINPLAFVAELIRDGTVPDIPHLPLPVPVEVWL